MAAYGLSGYQHFRFWAVVTLQPGLWTVTRDRKDASRFLLQIEECAAQGSCVNCKSSGIGKPREAFAQCLALIPSNKYCLWMQHILQQLAGLHPSRLTDSGVVSTGSSSEDIPTRVLHKHQLSLHLRLR